MSKTQDNHSHRRKLSLTTWIVIGVLAGIGCGLFFGEYCTSLKWIGDAYVGLMQMAVLPYVSLSLVVNVGNLSFTQGRRLLKIGLIVILSLWAIGLVMMLAMTQAFPHWQTGSFFSSSLVEEPTAPNWLELFIPSNPFRSLSVNAVPAVVIFSIGIGIALISLPGKSTLLEPLNVIVDALAKLNKLVVGLSPIGMFGIVAYTAGTIDFQQFELIQGYLLTYGMAAVLLCFVVLPALVSSLTPFTTGEVLRVSRNPLIAAFVIGNSFVVLPLIIEAVKELFEKRSLVPESEGHSPEYLVPLAYPFPDIGRIVGLIFIPFAAWFYGTSINPQTYPAIIGTGILGAFGKPVITIPVLLNIAHLPGDIFNLFLASGVIAARFGDLMKCMHLFAFTILTSCAMSGALRLNGIKLLTSLAVGAGLTVVSVMGIRIYLDASFKDSFGKEQLLTDRQLTFYDTAARPSAGLVSSGELEISSPNPHVASSGLSRVQNIQQSRVLRVGFDPAEKLPFSYRNADDKLVGFDVDMMHFLAYDLIDNLEEDVKDEEKTFRIEFVPYDRQTLAQQLADDHFDIAISGLEGTVEQAATLPATDPYMTVTLALVVLDYDKNRYQTASQIRAKPDLKLAVITNSFFAERFPRVFPKVTDHIREVNSAAKYFEEAYQDVDGLVISAEEGAAWTLLFPQFTVTNPLKGRIRVPLYYLTAPDVEFEGFLHNWITMKRNDGTTDDLYDYWIQGKQDESKSKRWSVIRWLRWVN